MQTLRDQDARRAWTQVQAKLTQAQDESDSGPTMGEVFRQGFMHASMLQLAVCAPGRHARTASRAQVLMAKLGEKTANAVSAL